MNLLMNVLGLERISEEKINLTPDLLRMDRTGKDL